MLFESGLSDFIYDDLFKNTLHGNLDFIKEFPASYVDFNKAVIYLAKEEGKELFKIKIERVNHA
jgi:hypothetical protein